MNAPAQGYRRLARLAARATTDQRRRGLAWYARARRDCLRLAGRYGVTLEVVAAIVAVLSPRLRWELNLAQAERVLQGRRSGFSAYGHNVKAARAIFRGEPIDRWLRGPKVRVFYRCLLGELEEPCMDSHAMNAWFGRRVFGNGTRQRMLVGERRAATRDYCRLARNLEITAGQAQAIVWIVWREAQQKGSQWKS